MERRGTLQKRGAKQALGVLEVEITASVSTNLKVFLGKKARLINSLVLSYWEYLGALTLVLLVLQTYSGPNGSPTYTQIIGYVGLAIEAILPLPQVMANQRAQSCKGFRVSVLANWLIGDAMKMSYFFMSDPGKVPWAFKMCGIFQACCDAILGIQYWVYGNGPDDTNKKMSLEKDGRIT